MSVLRLLLTMFVLLFGSMTISSIEAQRVSRTCRSNEHFCWGLHHPRCTVLFEESTSILSNSVCRLKVQCNNTSDFFTTGGPCFAGVRPFPLPKKPGLSAASMEYNFNLELTATDGNVLLSRDFTNNRGTAKTTIIGRINHFADQSLASIKVISSYPCNSMTPCTLTN